MHTTRRTVIYNLKKYITKITKRRKKQLEPAPRPLCQVCGKPCERLNAKYCSLECANKANTKINISEKKIIDLLNKGWGVTEIARKFNTSHTTIRRKIKKFGIKYNQRKSPVLSNS